MRDPLIRRLPRELKSDAGKYIIIFIFMVIVIGFVSGFLVASQSLITAYNDSFENYNIEDGNFTTVTEADDALLDAVRGEGAEVYENFYKDRETDDIDSTLRIYKLREVVNRVGVNEGALPSSVNEIAIDRMYADNNSIKVGDVLSVDGRKLTVTGLVALSDYSALYQSPTDTLFEAFSFGVAVMTEQGFDEFDDVGLNYNYAWTYNDKPADNLEAKDRAESMLDTISEKAVLTRFVPAYTNQAIQFVGDDTGRDRVTFITFLYVVIAILAFIMAITTSNTITKEANVIGTLRASGYTRGELIRHYLSMPALVTLISAVIGNIVGYTLFVEVALGIYYGNYSLPLFDILWNADAFVQTTVIPVLLMIAINFFILSSKMKLSPLKFIRRDLKKNSRKKALRLNTKLGIMHRFRIRVILQNLPNYIMIVVGIFLANVILLLGMGFPKLLENNETLIAENMICDYQYILKAPVETENDSAEKYCAGGLMTIEGRRKSEAVTIYGISSDSSYFDIEFGEGVFISEAFAAKNSIEIGDNVTMKEEFSTKEYSFTVDGISGSPTTLAVYMERSYFNEVFDNETDYFNGYFSDEELTDIDELYIMNKLTIDDFTKLSRQMNNSMGEVFDMFYWFGLVMFMLIIYLLSKIIIEKNAQSISMTKILGYTNSEISGLYVITTSIVVIASFIITMPIVDVIMRILCAEIFAAYAGWIPYSVPASVYVTIIAMGIAAYAVIAFLQFRRVKKIPLDTALKNVE